MLFWISIILLAVGAIILKLNRKNYPGDFIDTVGISISVISAIVALAMLIGICVGHIGVDAYVDQMNVRYDMLVYQYENEFYENDNDVGKRELIADIQSWNEDLAKYQTLQDNLWVGICWPNIYDQFEFIELK